MVDIPDFSILIGYEYPGVEKTRWQFWERKKMRRSKRKASSVVTQRLAESQTPTSAEASATTPTVSVEDEEELDYCEGADLSDDEKDLNGAV